VLYGCFFLRVCCSCFLPHRIYPHRLVESLQFALAHTFVFERESFGYRLIRRSLHVHPTWLCQLLKSLRENDSFSRDRAVSNQYLAHGNTNPHHRADLIGQGFVVGGIGGLEIERCGDRVRSL